jgi:penicillin-binding protein 2
MRAVSEVGTASNVFGNYPITVAGKTGTASVSKGTANGVFVCFAPYENPEIAIAVVVEHAGSGNGIAPIARAMLDAYFGEQNDGSDSPFEEMTLIH